MFIVKTKKEIMGLALILFIGITSGVIINISPIKGVFSINKNIKTIIIDAGHGLPDGGTTGNAGTVEQEINLQIAKKTEEVLNGKGYRIIMTRTSNESLAMDENSTIRKRIAIKALYKASSPDDTLTFFTKTSICKAG